MKNQRNNFLDVIKGIAIILVVLGHCIQYGSGNIFLKQELYFDNLLFKIIYSFHMPLFALISGYLYYFSLKKDNKQVLKNKIKSLFIPILIWGTIDFIISIITKSASGNIFIMYLRNLLGTLWFLWALLINSVIILLVKNYCKDNILVYIIIGLIMFVIPDFSVFRYVKFLYLSYLLGYFANKYNLIDILNYNKNKFKYLFLLMIIFAVMILFFNKNIYIYTTGFTILGKDSIIMQIYYDLYRWIIGIFGSLLVLIFVNNIKLLNIENVINKILINCSKYSLGIYIINGYVNKILPKFTFNFEYNIFIVLMETIIVFIICLIITKIISKIKILNKLMLGGR